MYLSGGRWVDIWEEFGCVYAWHSASLCVYLHLVVTVCYIFLMEMVFLWFLF